MDLIVDARGVRKVYRNGTEVEALKSIDLQTSAGGVSRHRGPIRVGQDHPSELPCRTGADRRREILVDGNTWPSSPTTTGPTIGPESMGFVFQALNLLPVLTAGENVEIPMLLLGSIEGGAGPRALETLELVGLAARAAPPRPAIRGRTAAGRRRPGARPPTRGRVGGRADRDPDSESPPRDEPVPGAERDGPDHRDGDPQPRGRGVRASHRACRTRSRSRRGEDHGFAEPAVVFAMSPVLAVVLLLSVLAYGASVFAIRRRSLGPACLA